jgi:hypothetical protein
LVHYLTDIRLVLSLIFGAIHQLRKYLCTKKQLTSVVGRTLPFHHSSAETGNCQADSEDTLAKLGNILLYMVILVSFSGICHGCHQYICILVQNIFLKPFIVTNEMNLAYKTYYINYLRCFLLLGSEKNVIYKKLPMSLIALQSHPTNSINDRTNIKQFCQILPPWQLPFCQFCRQI